MSEISRFYDKRAGDQEGEFEYPSHEFAEYFAKFLTNGVYTEGGEMGLKVTMSGLTATIGAGFAFIRGYMYAHEAPLKTLTLSAASTIAGLDRIDRIVLRLDVSARTITAELKTGTAASSPTAPSLTNTGGVYEIPIARVLVKANASTGTATDERKPVSSLIEIPYADMMAENQAEFNTWIEALQEILDENTAANLLSEIQYLQQNKMDESKIILSAQNANLAAMRDGDIWIKYE